MGKHSKRHLQGLAIVSKLIAHEEVIHHLIEMKFAYLLVQGSCFAVPFSLLPLLSYLQCCLLAFSRISQSLQFTVYCTQNSGPLKSAKNIYHMFHIGGVALQA